MAKQINYYRKDIRLSFCSIHVSPLHLVKASIRSYKRHFSSLHAWNLQSNNLCFSRFTPFRHKHNREETYVFVFAWLFTPNFPLFLLFPFTSFFSIQQQPHYSRFAQLLSLYLDAVLVGFTHIGLFYIYSLPSPIQQHRYKHFSSQKETTSFKLCSIALIVFGRSSRWFYTHLSLPSISIHFPFNSNQHKHFIHSVKQTTFFKLLSIAFIVFRRSSRWFYTHWLPISIRPFSHSTATDTNISPVIKKPHSSNFAQLLSLYLDA